MDHRLVAWARGVKARRRRVKRCQIGRRGSRPHRNALPVLWLFTDARRVPDPVAAIKALPRGLCGVVFRHDGVAGREALARAVAQQCRSRGIPLVVAGDARLAAAIGAGVHLRRGRPAGRRQWSRGFTTSSAHSRVELRRARLAGVDAVFLSPLLPTTSHPGAPALGVARWAAFGMAPASRGPFAVLALGGVDGRAARRLPRWCAGVGAITALLARCHDGECG